MAKVAPTDAPVDPAAEPELSWKEKLVNKLDIYGGCAHGPLLVYGPPIASALRGGVGLSVR